MKKLILLLIIPLLSFGQGWEQISKNEKDLGVLLEKLNICVVDKNNNSEDGFICSDDDYSIFYLDNYLVVFVEGRENYNNWCGEVGCAILVFQYNERDNVYKEIDFKTGTFHSVYPDYILYTSRDGDEDDVQKIAVTNNKINVIYLD